MTLRRSGRVLALAGLATVVGGAAMLALTVVWGGGGVAAQSGSAALKPFFGTYVGSAAVDDPDPDAVERRDLDIVIQPYDEAGFRLHWVSVNLVDGRRDLPGVERRVQTVFFVPAEEGEFYVEVAGDSLFREREAMRPMAGDPVRWATVQDGRMDVFSFVVLDDGRYEMQIYERRLDGDWLDIQFQRIVDGEVLREINGRTVRTGLKKDG